MNVGPEFVSQLESPLGPQLGPQLGPELGSDWGQTLSKMVTWDAIGFDFYPRMEEESGTKAERREKTERGSDRRGRE